MRYLIVVLSILLSLGACVGGEPTPGIAPNTLLVEFSNPDGRVLVAAHRGCWADAPENSIAALEACATLGVDIVEIDLRFTADGEVVAFHDARLSRMAGVDLRINDLTLAELQTYPLRNRNGRDGAEFTSLHVPTLREVLRANSRRMLIILDLKDDPAIIAPAAAAILRDEGACELAMFALVAPPETLRSIAGPLFDCASYLPNLRVSMGIMSEVVTGYSDLHPAAIAVRFDDWLYLEEGVESVTSLPARLWVNTLNDYHAGGLTDADALEDPDALWGRLVDAGVNIIQTDEPEALIAYLKQRH